VKMRIALVACAKRKRGAAAPAGDLYISHLFQGLRRYAEAHADRWYILSAEHGVLDPEKAAHPYERTLNGMPRQERAAWAARVNEQLTRLIPSGAEIILLAGKRYREGIEPFLREKGFGVWVPFAGMRIGEQLQRLKGC
jgi:hypothetical protein